MATPATDGVPDTYEVTINNNRVRYYKPTEVLATSLFHAAFQRFSPVNIQEFWNWLNSATQSIQASGFDVAECARTHNWHDYILSELKKSLQTYMEAHPNEPLTRDIITGVCAQIDEVIFNYSILEVQQKLSAASTVAAVCRQEFREAMGGSV